MEHGHTPLDMNPHQPGLANGTSTSSPSVHVHADAPPPQREQQQKQQRSLRDVCLELRDRVDAFLQKEHESPLLKGVQEQVRVSIGVVDEALKRYS